LEVLVDALLVLIVVLIHTAFRPLPALLVSVGALALLVLCGTWIAFEYTGYRWSPVALLITIIIEQMLSSAERSEHHSKKAEGAAGGLAQAARNFATLESQARLIATSVNGNSETADSILDIAEAANRFAAEASKDAKHHER
jgi:hypothetical protein